MRTELERGLEGLRPALTPLARVLHPRDAARAQAVVEGMHRLAATFRDRLPETRRPVVDEATAYLICYGDSICRDGQPPLATLAQELRTHVGDAVTDVHLLPIFPWTSDDGFAVVDYREVDPELGQWHDVAEIGRDYQLMLDFVANHTSASSPWFTGWLAGDERYRDYYLAPGPEIDTSKVVRPRTTPLLHPFERPDGHQVAAWTTFGPDQVDLNVANPATLLELTEILLEYIVAGATTVRLDAIGYLWKESGTGCIHLPATHAVIKMWRVVVDAVAPGVRLLTETNVPHAENITYLGDGSDEAHMVYQFALPPLVLHSFVSGSSRRLTDWAASLEDLGDDATWFNFLASHDGIGMRPAQGILSPHEQEALARRALAHGGRASYATGPGPERSIYELNVSYLDALVDPSERADVEHVIRRVLAAHAILLGLAGVPAIYYHSIFGSTSDLDGLADSGINRRINRERLDADTLADELRHDPRRRGILNGLKRLLTIRAGQPAFSPFAQQRILDLDERVFAVERRCDRQIIRAVVNVSSEPVDVPGISGWDLLTESRVDGRLGPDDVVWVAETLTAAH
ncbi:DUF3459 domain-containing protein [Myceligenerans sp. I2]|uniref:DUF3459 domain-containing protein n=1 Tax=Myceligenerans indicum TaxID=2593663 RepID=A0ABS1LMS3_9MICO|nr:DUF3459 domain-containing protein [Myceligenerans indicum]